MVELYVPLRDGDLHLELLIERHREPLRLACAEDPDIWEIYPFSYVGDHFDDSFVGMLNAGAQRQAYAIFNGDAVVGMTAWIAHGAAGYSTEIGNSYIVPRLRGTGFNTRLKTLMIGHAFACGLKRVALKVDAINARSQAAVMKLGCTREGLMRAERVTWTGRIRDTVIFSVLADEWAARLGSTA